MLDEGANVFRINFSHADYEDVKERIKMIRELSEEFGYNTSILADLQGPKLRVGKMKEEVEVNPGDIITFSTAEEHWNGNETLIIYAIDENGAGGIDSDDSSQELTIIIVFLNSYENI